jgi:hypothetical protein
MPLLRCTLDPLRPSAPTMGARRAGAAIGTIHDKLGYEASDTLCAVAYRQSSNHDALHGEVQAVRSNSAKNGVNFGGPEFSWRD